MTDLTRDEIESMEAGREMDVLIACHVFGWTQSEWSIRPDQLLPPEGSSARRENLLLPVPQYSTSIAAAWQVVEKVTDPRLMTPEMAESMTNTKFSQLWNRAELWACTASEAALTICRMALIATLDAQS